MQMCNNRPPLQIKNKDKWIGKERVRWAKQFNIPFAEKNPEPFPQLTLGAMRALCAVALMYPNDQAILSNCFAALYQAFWVERQTISQPEVYGKVFENVFGEQKGKEVMAKSQSKEAKDLLKANTDLAFEEGAFGLPYFVATNTKGEKEGFWGFDHIGQVIDHLGIQRTLQDFKSML